MAVIAVMDREAADVDAALLTLVLQNFFAIHGEYSDLESWEVVHPMFSLGWIDFSPAEDDMELAHAAVVMDWPTGAA